MRVTLRVTDTTWARFIRERDGIVEANFCVPSGRNFPGRSSPDEPFLFRTKVPQNRLVITSEMIAEALLDE